MNEKKTRVPIIFSWPAIIIATILLWPMGAVFVWRRGQYDRKTALNLGTIYMVAGGVLMVIAVAVAYALGDAYIFFGAINGICGVVFARMGYEAFKKAKVYRKIIFQVENEGVYMVPMLADEVGMPELDVIKRLIEMEKKNLLPGFELARNNKKLVKK